MNNEKQFLPAIIITVIVLAVYPMVIKQFFPHLLPEPRSIEPKITADMEHRAPKAEQEIRPTLPGRSVLTEKSYVLENNKLQITVTQPWADISQVVVKKFIDPANNAPTVLIDTQNLWDGIFTLKGVFDEEMSLVGTKQVSKDELVFDYEVSRLDLQVSKRIKLLEDSYAVIMEMVVENAAETDQVISYGVEAGKEIEAETGIAARYSELIAIANAKAHKRNPRSIKKPEEWRGPAKVIAIKNQYFSLALLAIAPADHAYNYREQRVEHADIARIGLGIDNAVIPANSSQTYRFMLYAGPNNFEDMNALNVGLEDILGRGALTFLADFLMILLRGLFGVFKNYGIAVIMLSVLINVFLYPLTIKSLRSMKEMQLIQPEVEKLRTQFKDNPQKLNKEIMELYKERRVNPMGGCLPMLFQMPIFFALYNVLMRAIELRGARFLWIRDLSGPDAAFVLTQELPFIGSSINILPVIMMILTFAQQKMTSSGQASEQQKMIGMIMPVFMGVIFYNFPSGLVLYFLTNTVFSVMIQVLVFSKTAGRKSA